MVFFDESLFLGFRKVPTEPLKEHAGICLSVYRTKQVDFWSQVTQPNNWLKFALRNELQKLH